MPLLGWATGGTAGCGGPSNVFGLLPFRNYRDQTTWVEEFIDAIGLEVDKRDRLFIGSAVNGQTPARTNLLDPSYSSNLVPSDTLATATASPNLASIKDTMLDVLLYIAGIPWPVDTVLSIAQRQALVKVGWTALRRKGTRRQLLNLCSQMSDNVAYGWTVPPYMFSVILPDGAGAGGNATTPGWGGWVQQGYAANTTGTATFTNGSATVTGAGSNFLSVYTANGRISANGTTWYLVSDVASDTSITLTSNYAGSTATVATYYSTAPFLLRPPLLRASRSASQRIFPAWGSQGIGYSQFRAGFSGAGETIASGASRISYLNHEHFDQWSSGLPSSWTSAGTVSPAQNTQDLYINYEFTGVCCLADMTSQKNGSTFSIYQSANQINSLNSHRFELDYSYANAVNAAALTVQIKDVSASPTYYWNPTSSSWSSSAINIPAPPCSVTALGGTVTVTNGFTTVTGSGTSFRSQLRVGQRVSVDKNTWYVVAQIESDTQLEFSAVYAGSTAAGQTGYSMARNRYACDVVPQRKDSPVTLTGTITAIAGATTVTGASTKFLSELAVGKYISADKQHWYVITAIASNTSLTIALGTVTAFSSATGYWSYLASTTTLQPTINVTSDGTLTTQQQFMLYRAGLYDKFSVSVDENSSGERTLWTPLDESMGTTTAARTGQSDPAVEPSIYDRSAYAAIIGPTFPYHPALTGRAFQANSAWTNLLKGSNDFLTNWAGGGGSPNISTNQKISPLLGETSATATLFTAVNVSSSVVQAAIVADPSSKSYIAGLWVKKISTDGNFTDVTLSLSSGGNAKSVAFAVTQAQGWTLLAMPAQTFDGGDVTALQFKIAWGAASNSGQLAVASSYVYEVTGKTGVLYPPITQSAVGATGTLHISTCSAASAGIDPLTRRGLVSTVSGGLIMTVVPTFDGSSQPNGVIFDAAKNATHDRVRIAVASGTVVLSRWDDAALTSTAAVTLSDNLYPSAAATGNWNRDTAVKIRALWNSGFTSLSVNGGTATSATPANWAPVDTSVATVMIGNDIASNNQFDGLIGNVEVVQIGAPTR